MKICVACNSLRAPNLTICPDCGESPRELNGFPAYAPELDASSTGYKDDFYEEYAHLESGHFWFRARASLILWALKKYAPDMTSFFEIGCGTGYVLGQLAAVRPRLRICGSEIFTRGLHYASKRLPDAELIQVDARELPYRDEFDAIGAFDVLEHIEEDCKVLEEMCAALKVNGLLIVTVPQHQWLWSSVDEYSHHVRRYSEKELNSKICAAGFRIVRSSSFVTALLPLMVASRWGNKSNDGEDDSAELEVPLIINRALYFIMYLEQSLIRLGLNLPIGGSRLVVARKAG